MKKKFIRISVIVTYIYLAVAILGSYFVTPRILDFVGDSNYGLLSFCNSITVWLATISTALGSSYIFFAKKESEDCSQARNTNTTYLKVFAIIASVLMTVVLSVSVTLYFCNVSFSNYSVADSKTIYLLLAISGANVCITIFTSFFHVFLIAKNEFLFLRIKILFFSIITYALNILFAYLTHSVISIAIITLATTILTACLNIVFAIFVRKLKINNSSLKQNGGLIRSLLIYSSFILIDTIISTINNNIDKTLLGIIVDSKTVTYYSLAFTFSLYLTQMSGSITESFLPKIHDLYNNNKNEEANKLFLKVSKLQTIIMLFVVIGFIACGYNFCLMWIKQERIQVFYYAVALNLLTIVPLTSVTSSVCERALNKHKFRAILYLIAALVNVSISIILLKTIDHKYSIWCCIIGTAVSKIISEFIIIPIYDKKVIGLSTGKYYLNLLKISIFSVIALITPILYHFLLSKYVNITIISFLIEGSTFAITYIALLILFERRFIFSLFPKRGKATQ